MDNMSTFIQENETKYYTDSCDWISNRRITCTVPLVQYICSSSDIFTQSARNYFVKIDEAIV